MTEIVLVTVIAILSALLGWMDFNNRKERKSLLNALKAKDAAEMANLELADKTKIEVDKKNQGPDLVPVNELDDDEFIKRVIKPIVKSNA